MRLKKLMPLLIFILVIIVLCTSIFLYVVFSRENISYEGEIDNTANNITTEEAKNSTPVIINNILIGGVYNKKFVSADKFLQNSTSIANVDLGAYTMNGKAGTYQLINLEKSSTSNVIYANTSRLNYIEEYIAVIDNNNMQSSFMYEVDEKDKSCEEIVKKAISKYILPNDTVKVLKAYQGTLDSNKELKIVTATNGGDAKKGVYSAIVAKIENKVIPIKINYIKDVNYSSSWPLYNLKFIYDLNNDGVNEIVIEEVDEFNVKYSIMEFKNNKFIEVLSVKKPIK